MIIKNLLSAIDTGITFLFQMAFYVGIFFIGCSLYLNASTLVFIIYCIILLIWGIIALEHATNPKNYFVQFGDSVNKCKSDNEVIIDRWESEVEERARVRNIKLPSIPRDLL